MNPLVLEIETDQFPSELEGELDYCNGAPGSKFAEWLRERLQAKGYSTKPILQEDYGWGFWSMVHGCQIWTAVTCSGPTAEGSMPLWHIMVCHEAGFNLIQWFKLNHGKRVASEVFKEVDNLIRKEVVGNITYSDILTINQTPLISARRPPISQMVSIGLHHLKEADQRYQAGRFGVLATWLSGASIVNMAAFDFQDQRACLLISSVLFVAAVICGGLCILTSVLNWIQIVCAYNKHADERTWLQRISARLGTGVVWCWVIAYMIGLFLPEEVSRSLVIIPFVLMMFMAVSCIVITSLSWIISKFRR